jgi:glutamine amidotransferase
VCRHLAYVGPPVALGVSLFDAPHSLCAQARHPDHQRPGRVNQDGWGVGWFGADGRIAGHYRTTTPMWDDTEFPHRDVETGALVAAARLASPGAVLATTGNAPFRHERWLFSLNGYVKDFREGAGDELRAALSAARRAGLAGDSDSEVVFAHVLDRLDAGAGAAQALRDVVARVTAIAGAKLNLLLADGDRVYATRLGNSLFARPGTVVSEPLDRDDAWEEIVEGSIVQLDRDGYRVDAL